MSSVVVHGDFHMGNIMWKLDNRGEVTNEIAAIYDWQIYHEGSPMADFARMMIFCSDGGIRRQAEEFVFDFYHDLLNKEMKEAGRTCPYTVDQIRKAYYYMFLTQSYRLIALSNLLKEILKEEPPRVRQAKVESAILRCKHGLEDMDRLLTGEMKDVFERFGQ